MHLPAFSNHVVIELLWSTLTFSIFCGYPENLTIHTFVYLLVLLFLSVLLIGPGKLTWLSTYNLLVTTCNAAQHWTFIYCLPSHVLYAITRLHNTMILYNFFTLVQYVFIFLLPVYYSTSCTLPLHKHPCLLIFCAYMCMYSFHLGHSNI